MREMKMCSGGMGLAVLTENMLFCTASGLDASGIRVRTLAPIAGQPFAIVALLLSLHVEVLAVVNVCWMRSRCLYFTPLFP